MDKLSPPRDEYATVPNLPGAALEDDSERSLLQGDKIGLRQPTKDTMAVSNPSAAAQSAGINGNTQARQCVAMF